MRSGSGWPTAGCSPCRPWSSISGIRREVGRIFPWLHSYRAYVPSFRADWGFVLATAAEAFDPLASGVVEGRFGERLGPGAGPRFYGPAVHRALFTLSEELAHLIGQKRA